LIAARRQRPALSAGSYRRILALGDLLLYVRQAGSEPILIALSLDRQDPLPGGE
jgi:alpha-glucosidase